MSIRCFVIGGNSLTIACSELLLDSGAELLGVISSSMQVADWARGRNLSYVDAQQDYFQVLQRVPFDYLFSIAHLQIVPGKVLALPQRGAINFHDGLLPDYAGLNVPVWALLNGEPIHGVTWHLMTAEADAGDILKQERFPVLSDDTAFRLNAKCFDAGIRSFGELIQELATNSPNCTQQDFSTRRYFSRANRPPAACAIDWRAPVVETDRLVRALNFGGYANPVGSPTMCVAGHAYVVTELKYETQLCNAEPGSIVGIATDRIQVAAANGVVELRSLATPDGRQVGIDEVVARLALRPGDQLDVLTNEQRERLTELNRQIAKSESFWAGRLAQVTRVESIAVDSEPLEPLRNAVVDEIGIPPEFDSEFGRIARTVALPAALAAFLARMSNVTQVSLAVENSSAPNQSNEFDAWVSQRNPVTLSINLDRGLKEVVASWSREQQLQVEHNRWLRDLVGRSPELRAKPELANGRLNVMGVQFVDDAQDSIFEVEGDAPLLVVPRNGDRCRLRYHRGLHSSRSVELFCQRFHEFLSQVATDPNKPLREISTLTSAERQQVLVDWNMTEREFPSDACMHRLFEQQAERTPHAESTLR